MNLCFVIPVYNHKDKLDWVVRQLEAHNRPCILVDDGSDEDCRREIDRIGDQFDWVTVEHLPENSGKGAAVMRGIALSQRAGYSHCFQIDADGQHDFADIKRFIEHAEAQPSAMILGEAVYDASVPRARLYGRYVTHFWVWVETLSFQIKDSMCGFRIYPAQVALQACNGVRMSMRMSFDTEIVVRMHWLGVPVVSLPTKVHYPADGVSHFRLLEDNLIISWTHTKLFFGMLMRIPAILRNRLR